MSANGASNAKRRSLVDLPNELISEIFETVVELVKDEDGEAEPPFMDVGGVTLDFRQKTRQSHRLSFVCRASRSTRLEYGHTWAGI